MANQIGGQVGSVSKIAGQPPFQQGDQAEMILSELHGRFYRMAKDGNLYAGGMTTTPINNATFTTADANSGTLATAATSTPIIGLYNPASSAFNAIILQAHLNVVLTALTATGPGGLVWVVYTGQNAISTGSTPFNVKSLIQGGSVCKVLAGVALTGLSSTQANIFRASALSGGSIYNVSEVGTAAGFHMMQVPNNVENLDGSIVLPPGGVLGLFGVTTPVAHSAASSLLWGEYPV